MKTKVAVVGTVGVPACYGGFETLVHQLVKRDNEEVEYIVYCSSKAYPKEKRLKSFYNSRLVYIPISSNGSRSILYDIISLFDAVFRAKIILVLGVSGMIILPFLKFFCRKHSFIVHIDGLEWRREKWNRVIKFFLKASEAIAVKYANRIIADNKAIQDYVTEEYSRQSTLIAYGADHIHTSVPIDPCRKRVLQPDSYAFSVCRIEPENNVHVILEAFARCSSRNLKFVGNWQNSKYGRRLFQKYSCYPNIELLDPVYDQKKLDQLRSNCLYYMHGHSAGGTNPSLVEAMYLSLPVVCFDVSYNRETTENKAIYFTDEVHLVEMIKTIDTIRLSEFANQLKMVSDRRYTWSRIGSEYVALIKDVQEKTKVIPVFAPLRSIISSAGAK